MLNKNGIQIKKEHLNKDIMFIKLNNIQNENDRLKTIVILKFK